MGKRAIYPDRLKVRKGWLESFQAADDEIEEEGSTRLGLLSDGYHQRPRLVGTSLIGISQGASGRSTTGRIVSGLIRFSL
jgi:hypothetical protein